MSSIVTLRSKTFKNLALNSLCRIYNNAVTYQRTTCCTPRPTWKRAWTKSKPSTSMKWRRSQESSFGVTTRATFSELPCSWLRSRAWRYSLALSASSPREIRAELPPQVVLKNIPEDSSVQTLKPEITWSPCFFRLSVIDHTPGQCFLWEAGGKSEMGIWAWRSLPLPERQRLSLLGKRPGRSSDVQQHLPFVSPCGSGVRTQALGSEGLLRQLCAPSFTERPAAVSDFGKRGWLVGVETEVRAAVLSLKNKILF